MKLKLSIKPIKVSAANKQQLQQEIQRRFQLTVSGLGNIHGWVFSPMFGKMDENEKIAFVNYEKFRRKARVTNKGREVVREARWDAYVYFIPRSMISEAWQFKRFFRLKIQLPSR